MFAFKLASVPVLDQLRADIARAKTLALEGTLVETFDHLRNKFDKKKKPDLHTYTKLLELEARIFVALELDRPEDAGSVEVGAAELREILEGLEKNGTSESTAQRGSGARRATE